jgi:hypothetical protein
LWLTHLINGVVHHFIHQVVQAALPCAANVHAWALPHWLKALKHLQAWHHREANDVLLCHNKRVSICVHGGPPQHKVT